jgi:hypothetical protein
VTPSPTITLSPTETLTPTPEVNRFFENSASVQFSYVHPVNWQKSLVVGKIYGWRGPDKSTLYFQDLGDAKTAKEAADYWVSLMLQGSEYEITSEGPFQTNANLDAYKVVSKVSNEASESPQYIVMYYFQEKGTLIQATFVRNWDIHQDFDAMIDQLMATFRF